MIKAGGFKTALILQFAMYTALSLLLLSIFMYNRASVLVSDMQDATSIVSPKIKRDNYIVPEGGEPTFVDLGGSDVSDTFALPLPAKSIEDIISWVTTVSVQLFTLDFFQADKQLSEAREYFTPEGYQSLTAALQDSGWLAVVKEKKLKVSAVLKESPSVLKHGVLDGAYSWVIHFPLLVSYESASESRVETRTFTVRVKRVDADFASGQVGIAIDSFVSAAGAGNI